MNIISNQKALGRLWAALYCDFERVLAKYMACKGWRYIQFAGVCREMEITLILHVTQGRGKTKDEHYNRIMDMILQMCKDLWLEAEDGTNRVKRFVDETMNLKRRLGAFFLLYTMFEKQPIQDRVKISFSCYDAKAFNSFCDSIKILDFCSEVAFMLSYLRFKQAFQYCIYSTEYRFDAATRNFLNNSKCEVVELTKQMRDIQDFLAYSSIHEHCENAFETLTASKSDIAKDLLKSVNYNNLDTNLRCESMFPTFVKTLPTNNFASAVDKIDRIVDQPVITLQTLTATEAIERRIMMETRTRMERARKKAMHSTDRPGEPKTSRPYVREGGIFGRKKETEEKDDKSKRRERGACTGNLWVYINGYDFDKPMGALRKQPPPAPTSEG